MESFISISMRKSLRSSTLVADFQSSVAADQRARAGLQVARLEVGTKTFQTRHKWKKKFNTLQVHPKPGGYLNTRSRGYISCKVQFSDSDTVSQTNVSTQPPFPPPQPQIGSPLLWISVGVGISIIFSWAARRVQGYAMQQALKSMMQQTGQSGNPFVSGLGGSAFGGLGVSPLPGMAPGAFTSSLGSTFGPSAASSTVDVTAQTVSPVQSEAEVAAKKPPEIKKSVYTAFTDVDISVLAKEDQQGQEQSSQPSVFQKPSVREPEVVDGNSSFFGASPSESETSSSGTGGQGKSFISIEMLETMLDDPKIQQMVFPYLPAEMRDPVTFKQMIQLPQVRQQLQEALNNMGGEDGLDMLKYMNSDVVKQQFEQIGLTPEEVVGKILASPDIATSLQNPKVVEAIMDCSQNPLNITKYQHDTEVMNALMKIAELFPGAAGSPN